MLFLFLIYLLFVWISYRLIKSTYRIKNTDLLGDVVALLVALVFGGVLTFVFAVFVGLLLGR